MSLTIMVRLIFFEVEAFLMTMLMKMRLAAMDILHQTVKTPSKNKTTALFMG